MIGADAGLYARNTIGTDPWTKEAWNVRRISTNGDVQMYADEDGAVFARTGIGTTWTKESGAATDPGFTAAIAAGPDGTPMYIDSGYFVYAKKGVALNGWTKEGTGLVDAFDFATSIAAGTGGIQMMITNDGGMADARASTGTTAWPLEQSLKALPGILFGEFIGCYKKITGASGGSLVDCGIVGRCGMSLKRPVASTAVTIRGSSSRATASLPPG